MSEIFLSTFTDKNKEVMEVDESIVERLSISATNCDGNNFDENLTSPTLTSKVSVTSQISGDDHVTLTNADEKSTGQTTSEISPSLAVDSKSKRVSDRSLPDPRLSRSSPHSAPGVILLGRGNSFSLGRSEVILLHNMFARKERNNGTKIDGGDKHLGSIVEHGSNKEDASVPSSPPPFSKMTSLDTVPGTNGWHHHSQTSTDDVDTVSDDEEIKRKLNDLWSKAEEMMAARQHKVLKVLEEFGIGEPDSGGGDDGGYQEEEQIWQMVQEKGQGHW